MVRSNHTTLWLFAVAFMLVLFAAPVPVLAQDARVHAQDARLRARLDPVTADSIENIIAMARDNSVPAEPLIQKALEGASKKASRADILRAVYALSTRLVSARRALGGAATDAELNAGASALYAGVDTATLHHLKVIGTRSSIAMPLISLSYFMRQGVNRDTAVQWTETVVRQNIPPEELLRLQISIDGDVKAGAAPVSATSARVQAMLLQHQRPQ